MTMSLYPHMLQEYYVRRVRELNEQRQAELSALRTAAQARAYRDRVKRKLRRAFGPMPRRTPLNVNVVDRLEQRRHTIEKLTYESRPGYNVTANLYLPKGDGPFPAVLGTCGHSADGKAAAGYQAFCRGLVHQGFAVLIYDPVSQGERYQYAHTRGRWTPKGRGVAEHNMAGKQMSLLGEFFGSWRAWDGIRGLDYLLSRPEVDRTHVGLTGNSGGGTLTTYLNMLDDRFTMAAPGCFVTQYIRNLENELPADSEQCPPGVLAAALDMADYYIAQAPRPVILLGQAQDFFDRRGLEATYHELRRFYKLLGAERNVALHVGPGGHGYAKDLREAMYGFFNRMAKVKGTGREPRGGALDEAQLYAAPQGQVTRLKGNRLIHELIGERAEDVRRQRKRVPATRLSRLIERTLNLPKRRGAPHYRVLRPEEGPKGSGYPIIWPYAVETERDIQAILCRWSTQPASEPGAFYSQPTAEPTLRLYLPHLSSGDDIEAGHVPNGREPLWSLDVRGIGRTRALTCGDTEFFASYGQDYFYAAHGQMLGESYCGRRVHDALAALDLLAAQGAERVHLIGRGLGAVIGALAGCAHPVVTQVTLKNPLLSFHELTQEPVFGWPLSSLPWGVLHKFDLPDCYRMLAKKKLRLVEPWNGQMRAMDRPAARAAMREHGLPLKHLAHANGRAATRRSR
ncbi:MAG: alpha/beta hydrolase family protein [Phycisphaeraceae bacterium]